MKARVKATGDIIEIDEDCSYVYAKNYDKSYALANLECLEVKENENPDYWDKLKHQAAIDIYCAREASKGEFNPIERAIMDATTLVEKLKNSNV